MHYLVTGHTGFKGAWLTLLLRQMGHEVSGISLDPLPGSLFEIANVAADMKHDFRTDIRDFDELKKNIEAINPDVLIHLAAQPLVRQSYFDPRETFESNFNGTLNVLEASQNLDNLKARLIITTDKVYRNVNQEAGYVESDPLGGEDPYSSSKAAADLLTQSWVHSFPAMPTAIARAGNVIGGGDVSPNRLIPDIVTSFLNEQPIQVRYPSAVRPWQHVLDCLNGYLALVEKLLVNDGLGEWNFGPGVESFVTVGKVITDAAAIWGTEVEVELQTENVLPEAGLLALDSTKALTSLDWKNKLVYPHSLEWTLAWDKALSEGSDAREITLAQITSFRSLS